MNHPFTSINSIVCFTITFVILLITCKYYAFTQSWMPTILNERGDTIAYTFPPNDSTYSHNSLIIKFKKNGLKLDKLCYDYDYTVTDPLKNEKNERILKNYMSDSTISLVMAQQFNIDSILTNPNLANTIKSYGGSYLSRITWANPCCDTVSITRYNKLILCEDYLWMTLHFENDTNMINIALLLTMFYRQEIELADLNYYIKLAAIPNDPNYVKQKSLEQIGMPSVWDIQTGNYNIKVGIIDIGIDYKHCDLGGEIGEGKKISYGWSFWKNNNEIDFPPYHGTQVAGIIGGLTNNLCGNSGGIAGIGGGWNSSNYDIGLQLLGFNYGDREIYKENYAIASLRVLSSKSPNSNYGNGVHIINMSWGISYSEPLRAAILYSYQNGVSLVASAMNNSKEDATYYPANFDPSTIMNIGASDNVFDKIKYSTYSKNLDIIAPGGDTRYDASDEEKTVYTTNIYEDYSYFSGTSAAAPHVSGVIGLLRSEFYERSIYYLEPEDYEGMLKSSALDRYKSPNEEDKYKYFYDIYTGWGHLKADNVFDMITNQNYNIYHDSTTIINSISGWSDIDTMYFNENYEIYPGNSDYRSDWYKARKREIFGTIYINMNEWVINDINNIFVWGRKGTNNIGGYSSANPNYQLRYTEVISGEGGNGIVPGIYHNHSGQIKVKSYQYEVWDKDGIYIGLLPPNNELGFNISIFGQKNFYNIKEINNNNFEIVKIFPNPFVDNFNIQFKNNINTSTTINIYDLQGNNIFYKYINNEDINQLINTIDLSIGIYILKINYNGNYLYYKLIKR